MAAIDISGLQRLAVKYQPDLKMLPFVTLKPEMIAMGINLLPGIQKSDKRVTFERKGGLAKPYKVGLTVSEGDLGKAVEMELKLESSYAYIQDNIRNYVEKFVVKENESAEVNVTKKHPFEVQMMAAQIATFSEDILYVAAFHGERDDTNLTAAGCIDGFLTKDAAFISAGDIAAAKGNYRASGSLAAPVDANDVTALENLIAWVRGADPMLKRNAVLFITLGTFSHVLDAYENKFKYKNASLGELQNYINERCSSNIRIVKNLAFGEGDKLVMFQPGNLDFGMDTMSSDEFIKIQAPAAGQDANIVGYWLQADYGTRINSLNRKMYYTNEGTNVANDLSGDYS